ncbi:hypothetical protein P3S68_001525 [Capsicum galapagoense]
MVLQDSKGDRIHASIGKYDIKFFKNKMEELGLYRINNFVITSNSKKFKTTMHRLIFIKTTSVEKITDSSFHMDIFNLHVVGQVVTYEGVQTFKQGDTNSVFINIVLEDDKRNRLSTTLWGELVDQIQPYLSASTEEHLIVVLQFMKVQKFRDVYSVRSCWYQTKLWINPSLPQSIAFKSRLNAACYSNYERLSQTSSQQCYSITDELAKGIVPFKYINDLIVCTEQAIVHRYRLQVRVMDETGLITLLLWNREAVQLMGKTAKELKEGLIDNDECSYPSELDDIVEKRLMFKVMVKESNIYKQDEIYKVLKFADDESLFKEYCHPSLKYIVNSHQEQSIKNNLSGCGSSVTEISVNSIEKQYTKRSKGVGKLSMQEYDVECTDKQSTNKIRKVIKKEKKHE